MSGKSVVAVGAATGAFVLTGGSDLVPATGLEVGMFVGLLAVAVASGRLLGVFVADATGPLVGLNVVLVTTGSGKLEVAMGARVDSGVSIGLEVGAAADGGNIGSVESGTCLSTEKRVGKREELKLGS